MMLQAMFRLSDYPVEKVQDGQPCTPHHSYHIHLQTPRALATTDYRTYTLLPREVWAGEAKHLCSDRGSTLHFPPHLLGILLAVRSPSQART